MKLFHRANLEAARLILKDGFKDRSDPTRTNLGFYNQIPEIKAVWFSDSPADKYEGRQLLIEIPDEIAQKVDQTVRMGLWGRSSLVVKSSCQNGMSKPGEGDTSSREYIIPAEIANQYGPPADVTDLTDRF